MQTAQPSLFAREDTFFGVCQGLGEDLGFNPLYLRLAFTLALFLNPVAALGGYAAAGVVVLAARLLFPNPRPAAKHEQAEAEREAEPLPLAA